MVSDWRDRTLAALTVDEKISLVAGRDAWRTTPIERLDIPSLKVTDGPNGARGEDDNHGPSSLSLPVGVAMGATFDPGLIESVGRALGRQAKSKSASVLLGPTVNIPRVPIAGRNFECFSEDPVLSGTIAGAYIRGVQSEGVGTCLKHFVCNDQEQERFSIDVHVDDRTLHEIYAEPFRIAIQIGGPWSVMAAYNTVNGTTVSENPLLNDVLRDELGFDGVVISDWYGTYGAGVVGSGLDLEMPGPARWASHEHWVAALDNGSVTVSQLDRKVYNLLTLIERTGARDVDPAHPEEALDTEPDRSLARTVAREAIVLLTNDGVLPLSGSSRIALIGQPARRTFHQGGGSSAVNAHRVVSLFDALSDSVGPQMQWTLGCTVDREAPPLDSTTVTHRGGDSGFEVVYFNGPDLAGEPVRTANARTSDLGFFGPRNRWVDYDSFSLRVTGRHRFEQNGPHTFTASAFGRMRVWFDDALVADLWDVTDGGGNDWVGVHQQHTWEHHAGSGDAVDIVIEYGSVPGARWRSVRLGCEPPSEPDPVADAVALARDSDVAVVVVGLGPEWESEGNDRPDMRLPGDQDRLVTEVASVQPNTIVVVAAGSPVEMPWIEDVAAVMYAWYGGQESGNAVADVLLGRGEPGGRLPVTIPVTARCHPGMLNYPGENGVLRYGEGTFVGYRGFDRMQLTPLFEFGHGLSFTSFELDGVDAERVEGTVAYRSTVTNTGERSGSEVIQVYAMNGEERKLVAFEKAQLEPGESTTASGTIDPNLLRRWDPESAGWIPQPPEALEIRGTFGRTRIAIRPLGA